MTPLATATLLSWVVRGDANERFDLTLLVSLEHYLLSINIKNERIDHNGCSNSTKGASSS